MFFFSSSYVVQNYIFSNFGPFNAIILLQICGPKSVTELIKGHKIVQNI